MGHQSRAWFGLVISTWNKVERGGVGALTNTDEISWNEIGAEDFIPFPIPECLDGVRGDTHRPKLCKSPYSLHSQLRCYYGIPSTYLKDDSTFKDNQHEQSKQGLIPILVQTPKCNTENLENKEWSDGMFGKQFSEFGNWDVTFVRPVRG
jgi:hypothetical protein